MKTLRFLLLLLLLAQAAPAEDSVTVPPLEIAPNARTERDFARAELAWGERALLAPFRARAEGKPWLEEACEFVRHALGEWPGAEITSEIARLSAQGQRLLAAGCDDPLIGYYATWARWMATDEHYGSREAFNKWRKAAEKLPGQSALARMATADFLRLNAIVQQGAEDAPKKYVELAVRAWSDGSYTPEEDVVFARHLVKDMTRKVLEKHQNALLVALQPVELPPWVRETLVGQAEIARAWQSRGSGFANTVTEEGMKGFEEHLEKAHRHLLHAWQLRKDQPMAATMLITVAMGGGVPEKESERLWFERAVAAQCDYGPAYDALCYSLMPQWGGDDGEILAIGKSCLATKRYDTEVPTQFFTALQYLNRMVDGRMPDIRDLLRRPDIAPFQRELLRGCLDEKTRADKRRIWQAWVAVDDWLRGDDAAAARSLADCGPETLPPEALLQLCNLGTDEVGFRGEVAVLNSPARALFLEAERRRGEEQYALAAETYQRAATADGGRGRRSPPRPRERRRRGGEARHRRVGHRAARPIARQLDPARGRLVGHARGIPDAARRRRPGAHCLRSAGRAGLRGARHPRRERRASGEVDDRPHLRGLQLHRQTARVSRRLHPLRQRQDRRHRARLHAGVRDGPTRRRLPAAAEQRDHVALRIGQHHLDVQRQEDPDGSEDRRHQRLRDGRFRLLQAHRRRDDFAEENGDPPVGRDAAVIPGKPMDTP